MHIEFYNIFSIVKSFDTKNKLILMINSAQNYIYIVTLYEKKRFADGTGKSNNNTHKIHCNITFHNKSI